VAGFEPNLPAPIDYGNGVVVHNALESMRGRTFDLVLVNHAFEHDHDPDRALAELLDFVTADGYIVLRMPLADSYAWRTYRGDWVQLDPPRHLVIQTRASIEILATRHGLEVVDEVRDSTEFQFAGSEQYRRRIPLRDARRETLFSTEELAAFRTRAERLNREGQGDQGRVVLRRSHAA
jgi:SAM-dependent methyltransferase